MPAIFTIINFIIISLWPFIVYLAIAKEALNYAVIILIITLLLRIFILTKHSKTNFIYFSIFSSSLILIFLIISFLTKQYQLILYYGSFVNILLFCFFFSSLWFKQNIIEVLARSFDKDFNDNAITYTKKVCLAWCIFFIFNACLCTLSSFISIEFWTIYNGLISYLLIALFMLCEYLIRIQVKKKYAKRNSKLPNKN